MYQLISNSAFHDAFVNMNRKENFSYACLNALYEYLTDCEEDQGIELDVIGLCCEFSELSFSEFVSYYDIAVDEDEDDIEQAIIDYIDRHGLWYRILNDSIIYQSF